MATFLQMNLFEPDFGREILISPREGKAKHGADAKLIGGAGATLVRFELELMRLAVSEAPETEAFDLVACEKNQTPLKVQVKSTHSLHSKTKHFRVTRGFHATQTGVYDYEAGDYDILALACLQLKSVVFRPFTNERSVGVLASEFRLENISRLSWETATGRSLTGRVGQ